MGDKTPLGATADYFQIALDGGGWCGDPHRSIENAVRCLQETSGAVAIVAIWKRTDAIGTERLYNKDAEYLTDRQVEALIEWREKKRGH